MSAYVYGNVLVMAALVSLDPEQLRVGTAVLEVLGVGFSTFVAHVVADLAGQRVRQNRALRPGDVRHELRNSLPIATSALVPAAILVLAWVHLVDPRLSVALTLVATDLRLALLGSAMEWWAGERGSGRMFLAGFGLAVAAATAVALKWWLSH